MPSIRVPLFSWETALGSSGYLAIQPLSELATNDLFKHLVLNVLNIDGVARVEIHGKCPVPNDYTTSPAPSFVIAWTSANTTGNVVFDIDYRAVGGNDSESVDQSSFQQSLSVTDAAPSTAWYRLETSVAATAANFSAKDDIQFVFAVDGLDASHTFTGVASILGVWFECGLA